MNKRERIQRLNGQKVEVVAKNWRDNEQTLAHIRAEIAAAGLNPDEHIEDTGNTWKLSNGQFFFKEHRPQSQVVMLHASGHMFHYGRVRCEYKDFQLNDDGSIESAGTLIRPLS